MILFLFGVIAFSYYFVVLPFVVVSFYYGSFHDFALILFLLFFVLLMLVYILCYVVTSLCLFITFVVRSNLCH